VVEPPWPGFAQGVSSGPTASLVAQRLLICSIEPPHTNRVGRFAAGKQQRVSREPVCGFASFTLPPILRHITATAPGVCPGGVNNHAGVKASQRSALCLLQTVIEFRSVPAWTSRENAPVLPSRDTAASLRSASSPAAPYTCCSLARGRRLWSMLRVRLIMAFTVACSATRHPQDCAPTSSPGAINQRFERLWSR